MIKIDRSRVAVPEILTSLTSDMARDEIRKAIREKRQEHIEFRSLIWWEARNALAELFHGKCAYCESPVVAGAPRNVNHFRPVILYPWLAYEWENLYLACPTCSRLKGLTFPVFGERAIKIEDLPTEPATLLDPCADDPAEHLRFDEDGLVYSISAEESPLFRSYLGRVTIDLLGLNRPELVTARAEAIQRVEQAWQDMVLSLPGPQMEEIRKAIAGLTGDTAPYAAAARQAVARLAGCPSWGLTDERELERILREITVADEFIPEEMAVEDVLVTRQIRLDDEALAPPLPEEKGVTRGQAEPRRVEDVLTDEQIGLRPAYVRSISLTNFKCFPHLELEIDLAGPRAVEEDGDGTEEARVGWLALVGENATGKSTVLEAVALALSPREWLDGMEPTQFITHGREHEGARVRLALESDEAEIDLRITKSGFEFLEGKSPSNVLIRGYGHVRLLATKEEEEQSAIRYQLYRVDNLFDPRAPLCDVERWLCDLHARDPEAFRLAATTIKDVLPGEGIGDLAPTGDGGIQIEMGGEPCPLSELSAGYQCVIALAADIMAGIPPHRLLDLRAVPGLVLVDEVGTQLHPRWRMRVVRDLGRAFPRMQFILSTHEPLCLRGLQGKEIVVFRRDEPRVLRFEEETAHDPAHMRVDQLLTSRFFGLGSTIDPDVDRDFQRYYYLLAKEERTDDEETRLVELERRLRGHGVLGYTRRDQVIYQIIDKWLADEGFRDGEGQTARIGQVPDEVRKRVVEMWDYARGAGEPE